MSPDITVQLWGADCAVARYAVAAAQRSSSARHARAGWNVRPSLQRDRRPGTQVSELIGATGFVPKELNQLMRRFKVRASRLGRRAPLALRGAAARRWEAK
jgi:hypothetical protein